jgi:hypothetical protein
LNELNRVGHDLYHAVSITTIHHALSLIATLLAWFSIAGLLFVALFLFQANAARLPRRRAVASNSRRPRMSEPQFFLMPSET